MELHKFPYSSQGVLQIYEFSSVSGKDNRKFFSFLEKAIGEMSEKHYLRTHITVLKEIRKPYELDYSDCCRIL